MDLLEKKKEFSPTICLTHKCNLSCVYCYQTHSSGNISIEIAKKCIDNIFENIPAESERIKISLIGGEPLLAFDIIKEIYSYTKEKYTEQNYYFFITTNGTINSPEIKQWLIDHRKDFIVSLSLDGLPEVHNKNRCNSYSLIDVPFYLENWPEQSIKMTLTEDSIDYLFESIKYIYGLGFKKIAGANFFTGDFDWNKDSFIKRLIPQLKLLEEFYLDHDKLYPVSFFRFPIEKCTVNGIFQKKCGIGKGTPFYDIDGSVYPCIYVTPLSFSREELLDFKKIDLKNDLLFKDNDCAKNCYLYPACPDCIGSNYKVHKCFSKKDKSKCKFYKLFALFSADLIGKKILKNPERYPFRNQQIEAIKMINKLIMPEFSLFFDL